MKLWDPKDYKIDSIVLKFILWVVNVFITPFVLVWNSVFIYLTPCIGVSLLNLLNWLTQQICSCLHACLMYTDSKFPPTDSSVGKLESSITITWKRASELTFAGKPVNRLFNGISPRDLGQGQLGDCWLLAGFAALCETPNLIQHCFITSVFNPFGKYKIRLFDLKKKAWVTIVIDDWIPCTSNGTPAFTSLRDNEIWPLLLEKAVAKLHGSYANLEGGSPLKAMMILTGFEGTCFSTSENYENLFKNLQHMSRQGCIMAAGSRGKDSTLSQGRDSLASSIVPGHAYTVLDIKTPTFTTSTLRLLKLRNPWGTFVWKGDWSDTSPLWASHPGVAPQIGKGDADDGIFYIEWKDFHTLFSHVDVIFPSKDINHFHLTIYEKYGRCLGPFCGLCTGCGYFWCLCQGMYFLWFPKSSKELCDEEMGMVKMKKQGFFSCCLSLLGRESKIVTPSS